MPLSYLHYDVFTAKPLLGNQLAVFTDARGLDTAHMQAVAREMNFSESTFILPNERPDTDIRMRIFTPFNEMPMAGHPTIGSTFALAHSGVIKKSAKRFVFGLNIGPTPVDLEWADEGLSFGWMTQRLPTFGPIVTQRAACADALGLKPEDLSDTLPVQEVSCGVPFAIVPVSSRAAIDRAAPEPRTLKRAFEDQGLPARHVYLFTVDGGPDGADVYTRMFAPSAGILEDAATGSASGPLGAYLVTHGLASRDETVRNLQGVKMGRPSWISIRPVIQSGAISAMRVGGSAVVVGTGTIALR